MPFFLFISLSSLVPSYSTCLFSTVQIKYVKQNKPITNNSHIKFVSTWLPPTQEFYKGLGGWQRRKESTENARDKEETLTKRLSKGDFRDTKS